MNGFQSYFQGDSVWPDLGLLGNFVDNHDNARFLHQNGDHIALKSALAFTLTSIGIPIVYYGDEQAYGGGNDPQNREPLWTNMDPNNEIYKFLATIINFRKQVQIWQYPQVQRYSDDNFYAFTRGNYFFAFTNHQNSIQRSITYHPYHDGEVLCNLFSSSDCVTVSGGAFQVSLNQGEVKIYIPKSSQELREEETIEEVTKIKIEIVNGNGYNMEDIKVEQLEERIERLEKDLKDINNQYSHLANGF